MSEESESTATAFLDALDAAIDRHALLKHPFYQMWSEGGLRREMLTEYAKQYYAHVAAFPRYVSAVHTQCEDISLRQQLLENLIEEERGADNHPELWLRFAEGLGISRNEVLEAEHLGSTRDSVARFHEIAGQRGALEGLAALYAYESQVPDVARTKREGLKAFYGLDDPGSVAFFTVHEAADVVHREMERNALAAHTPPERQRDVLAAAEDAAQALWSFLDGVYEAYCTDGIGQA